MAVLNRKGEIMRILGVLAFIDMLVREPNHNRAKVLFDQRTPDTKAVSQEA